MGDLIGLGTYTLVEAGRLLNLRPGKIGRWLRGHKVEGRPYERLWIPEIDLGDGRVFLGFRDLMEVRVADAFIRKGMSAVRMRAAIALARGALGRDHPLSTNNFRTDGRDIFLQVIETSEDGAERTRLLNLFRRQYEFREVIEPLLSTVEFDEDGSPLLWWPEGREAGVLIDPARSFGAPIEAETSVPTSVLATAARYGSMQEVAAAYAVPIAAVERALAYEDRMEERKAA